ncbi:uncharacterized protein LOC132030241 [Lycium ferocissimum]|uniref:uncharacterized protein LOC132030241 n=1 Tax=Lycium ferocissimum TaxID=112874 RepID=UPI0028157129|nr:uncharacterized protein LOC132030241 [Lycium ferocissimum]
MRLSAIEWAGPEGDIGPLQDELARLKSEVQALKAQDEVVLEDPVLMTQVNFDDLIQVKNLIEEDDSTIQNKGKRKWDDMDTSGEDPEEVTQRLGLMEDESLQVPVYNSLLDSYPDPASASSSRPPVESMLPSQPSMPVEPIVHHDAKTVTTEADATNLTVEATQSRDNQSA